MSATIAGLSDGSGRQVGYCTNVHAGVDLESIRRNLGDHAASVRDSLWYSHGLKQLGVGLWIPDQASRELTGETLSVSADSLHAFRQFMDEQRLVGFTINGFPFANFHGDSVKQRVYLPTWAQRERLEYTQRLAVILSGLMPEDQAVGSISTLPIGWPGNPFSEAVVDAAEDQPSEWSMAGENLRRMATFLEKLERDTGKKIVVAVEPEPGCILDSVDDIVKFFDEELSEAVHRSYITVCHDICHSAVMNESQREVIQRYAAAGITIGKVQVSSAIVADWKTIPVSDRQATLGQLRDFAEDRYLHQTGQIALDGSFELATDLPDLLSRTTEADLDRTDRWVIHFHVPIFLESFGHLSTSRSDVIDCLKAISDHSTGVHFTGHLEVETYAWTVLPESMRQRELAEDIASELSWLLDQLS